MSEEQRKRSPQPAASRAFRDFIHDDGFVPGLKPRIHAGSPAEFLAKYDLEPDDDASLEPGVDREEWRHQVRHLLVTSAKLDDPESAPAERLSERSPAAELASSTAGSPAAGSPAATARRRDFRRLVAARRELATCEPGNSQQRQLVGLLSAILDYLGANRRTPREREYWWRVFAAFRHAFDFPEMTGPRRRAAFELLVDLKAEGLFALARRGRMGRRMPDYRSTRRTADV